jgi:hypothetical protein
LAGGAGDLSLVASFLTFFSSSLRLPFSSRFLAGDGGTTTGTTFLDFSGVLAFFTGAGAYFLTGVLSLGGACFPVVVVCVFPLDEAGAVTSSLFSSIEW